MEKPGMEEMGLGPGVVPPDPALAPEPHCLWAAHRLPPWALASPSVTRGLGCLDDCLVAVLGVPLLVPMLSKLGTSLSPGGRHPSG